VRQEVYPMTRGTVWSRAALLTGLAALLAGAPAMAVSAGRISFTQMSIDQCEDFFGGCEWKLSCQVGGGAATEIVSNQPGALAQDIELSKSFDQDRFPTKLDCALSEDDGFFGESWVDAGKASLSIPGGGDYVLNLKGDQGVVLVKVTVDSFEIPDGPAAPAAAKPGGKPAKPAKASNRKWVGGYASEPEGHGVVLGLPWDAFKARIDGFAAAGVKLVDLQTWEEGGQRLWGGIFQTLEGNQELVTDLEWDPFAARMRKLSEEGMRLSDFEIYPKGNKFIFMGVYHEGADDNPMWIGQDRSDFISKWSNLSGGKVRLVDLETYRASGQIKYGGVFRGGSGSYGMRNAMTWDQLQEFWKPKEAEGRTSVVDIVAYTDGGKTYWDLVTGGGGGQLTQPMDGAAFAKDWKSRLGKGFRLTTVELVP
jgi:hypothetical protein